VWSACSQLVVPCYALSASQSACPNVSVTFCFPEHDTDEYSPTMTTRRQHKFLNAIHAHAHSLSLSRAAAICGFHRSRYAVMFWWSTRCGSVAIAFRVGSQVLY
jgi:hypothetical protein